MDENRVRLTIIPSGEDRDALSAGDFIKQVDALRKLVALAPGGREAETRVVRLSMNSPATIELEALPSKAGSRAELTPFFRDVSDVAQKAVAPNRLSREVFDALREMASVVGKGVAKAIIQTREGDIVIDVPARLRIEAAFGQDYTREGTIDGMLEAVNIHGKANNCALYPAVGPSRITCQFDDALFKEVKPALGKYVLVEGILKYRWRERHPFEAHITRLEILPGLEEQPKFADIFGFAPDATGGTPSEEFVGALRHGW
ncbi:hypothetical protein [Rubellimicrobium aerolatum]|uniref:Uncharacterized protein n=1 Tax=Rubellimicrobium aerolatum TaxID=490979 RepID=A0ABW0S8R2_9RHOB|nr:hypothetical protein [Rubellimicrobium aerolatum]MBP1804678.1 hypothetical protein [Rubellimicrobium aerolatum]